MLAGDVADLAADRAGVARPERVSRDEAMQRMSAMSLSFLSESRRLTNVRMTKELRLRLRYPSPVEGFVADA
jgi:hypothetical protein